MATEIAKQCADRIYETLQTLDSKDFPWVHNPHTFLPSNVILDQDGKMQFKQILTDTIQQVLDKNRGKNMS